MLGEIKSKFAQIREFGRPSLNFVTSIPSSIESKITPFCVLNEAAKARTSRRLKLGIVANEIFSTDVGRMGGFGWAVQQVSQCFAEDPTLGVEVVILMGE